MTIPPRFLDELRARITLSDVIGKKIRLTRVGREFKGCCPFHNEKTPSFYVNDDKQFYHCFGCGAHGSVIDFAMRHDNLSFPEAVETLAMGAGMQVPQSAPEDIERAKKEKSLYTLLDDAARWMEEQLRQPANKVPYDYILERGVPEEILRAFRVGFAPADMGAMRKYLSLKGYTDAQMIEAGVIKASDKGKEPYAFFRDRVMFPVPDRRGRIVAFGGRILPDHLRAPDRGDFKPPKYLNSSDTPLFHKGKMLYGEPHARMAASEGKPIVVVEGYLDVIACFRAGFTGAVAPLGTALTEDQIMVLWKMIPEESKIPVLCFDGDNAGRRAASRACERILPLLKPDHSAKIAFLPESEDPDSLIKSKGAGAFAAILDEAINLVDFLYQDATEGKALETPEARAGLAKTLEELADRITDRTVQHYYREAFRAKIRTAFAPVATNQSAQRPNNGYGGGYAGNKGRFVKGAQSPALVPLTPLKRPVFAKKTLYSMALLAAVINNPAIFHEVEEAVGSLDLPENGLDRLRQAVLSTLAADPALDVRGLKTHLVDQGLEGDMGRILNDSIYTHASFARPSSEPDLVLAAWQEAWKTVQNQAAQADIEQAKAALRENLNEENENRFNSLRQERGQLDG